MVLLSCEDDFLKDTILPRASSAIISANSVDVKVDDESVKRLSGELAESFTSGNLLSLKSWKDCELHPWENNDGTANFIFLMDLLNFSFWHDDNDNPYTVKYNGKLYTGYWSLLASLRIAEKEGKNLSDASVMATITEEELGNIFRSETTASIPMLKERTAVLNEDGAALLKWFNGSFATCIRSCKNDAMQLVRIIVDKFKSFRDVCVYNNQKLSILKRAQILVSDIWCCFEGRGLGEFKNIHELTMFADYRVPQALEYFGVLKYSKKLKEILDRGDILQSGCLLELEIRGCSIASVEQLTNEVKGIVKNSNIDGAEALCDSINAVTIDYYLWNYAKKHKEALKHLPIHKVRTIFY